jgi:hypothetical protein
MAMEAAESAYLAQLAADAKADAAAGYVEPWTMPASLDQFAGKEGDDDGGLYGEWDEDGDRVDAEDLPVADGSRAHAGRDDVIYAEPVSGYDQSPESDVADDDDFYGNGLESQHSAPQQQQQQQQQQAGGGGGARNDNHRSGSAAPAAARGSGRGAVEEPVHVTSESMSVALPAPALTPLSRVPSAGESRSLCCQLKAAVTRQH